DLGSLTLDVPAAEVTSAAAPAAPAAPPAEDSTLSLDLGDFDTKAAPEAAASAEAMPVGDATEVLELGGEINLEEPGAGGDEASTKLDLARAYIDMGDNDMAKSLLNEVAQQGSDAQKKEAQELLKRVPA